MPSAEPCLRLLKDEEDQSTLCIANFDDGFEADLPLTSLANKLVVKNLKLGCCSKRLFQIALKMKHYPQLRALYFEECDISELGPICSALLSLLPNDQQFVSLEFVGCTLADSAAATLKVVLQCNLIWNLSFRSSGFSADRGYIDLADGIGKSISLRGFGYYWYPVPTSLLTGIQEMLRNNRDMTSLTITIKPDRLWELLGAAVRLHNLKSLSIYGLRMDLQSAGAFAMLCVMLKSLKTLTLSNCVMEHDAWDYLVPSFSSNTFVDELHLTASCVAGLAQSISNLQVRKLSITGERFDRDALSQILDEIANNNFVKVLDLSGVLKYGEDFEKVCDVFLRQNHGPSDLTITNVSPHAEAIADALSQNTSLQSLTIANLGDEGVLFARGLSSMLGLRKLKFGIDGNGEEKYTNEFFAALKESLELNKTLWTLIFCDMQSDDPIAKQHLTWIRYFLAINRVGRRSLMTAIVATGIWARVLERTANDADGIYFVLTGKPDLVTGFNRKRRNCSDA